MEEDASPSSASSGGGAGGGKLEVIFSATWSLGVPTVGTLLLDVVDLAGAPAWLRGDDSANAGVGPISPAAKGLHEVLALRVVDLIRSNKLGSSEDFTIWFVRENEVILRVHRNQQPRMLLIRNGLNVG